MNFYVSLCIYNGIAAFIEIYVEARTRLTCSSYLKYNMQENNFVWLGNFEF